MRTASIVIGDHPHFAALRSGAVAPERLGLEFVEVEPTNRAFAPMLREGRYDISEIAITVFFQAIEAGKPVWLLPVVAMGGFHHGSIYRNPQAGPLAPGDLAGRRVAVRAYSQTTGLYVRGVLAEEHGVAARDVTWVTTEGSHVAEYEDPPNVERAPEGTGVADLLRERHVDAAILSPGLEPTAWRAPLIADAEAAAERWRERHGLIPINHVVCVGPAVGEDPEAVADLIGAFRRSHDAATAPVGPAITFDRERIETTLAYALGLARAQGLVRADLDIAAMFAPAAPPRTARWRQTHDRLVDAAVAEFAEKGYVAARIDDIATRAGATRATFYLHFGGKADVILELLDRGRGDFHPLWDELAALPRDPNREQVRAWVESAAAVWERHAERTRVVVQAVAADPALGVTQSAREQREIDLLTAAVRHMGWEDDEHARLECTLLFAQLARTFHLWSLVDVAERDERVLEIITDNWWAAFVRADRSDPAEGT